MTLGQLQCDGQAAGIDQRVDLGGQPAARATHATGRLQKPWSNRRQTDSLRQVEDGGWNGWATGLF